jgi:diacylglycerol kinase
MMRDARGEQRSASGTVSTIPTNGTNQARPIDSGRQTCMAGGERKDNGAAILSPYKGRTGLRRVWSALFYSIDGVVAAFRHEDAFRQEVFLALILIPCAVVAPVSASGKALMVGVVMLVLVVELLNSGIEAVRTISRSKSTCLPSAPRTWAAQRSCSRWSMYQRSGSWCCLASRQGKTIAPADNRVPIALRKVQRQSALMFALRTTSFHVVTSRAR